MTVSYTNDERAELLSRAVNMLAAFDEVVAVGLSGSSANGTADHLSDLDICVFATPDLPDPKSRRQRLESAALGEITYVDIDFEVSRGDGVFVNGKACDFIWMSVPKVEAFLKSLALDFECDEFLPGGLLKTDAVHDPDGLIERLQRAVPDYPRERAMYRVEKSICVAHSSLYVLRWLEKAVARGDSFSFLKFKYQLLDNFFTALFALNRQWFSDEKRLVEKVEEFDHTPGQAKSRLGAVIMQSGNSAPLAGSLKELKSLFFDLACLSRKVYPELEIPTAWD